MNEQSEIRKNDAAESKSVKGMRWLGLVGVAIGCALLWIFMFKPLQDARNQVAEITIVRKAALAGVVLTFFGFLVTIFGDGFFRMIPDMDSNLKDIPWYYWVTLLVTAILGVSLWFWFEGKLESLGYGI